MDLAALMQHPVRTVSADTTVTQARAVMRRYGIRHLPVLEAGRLVGLLTDRLLRRLEPSAVPALAPYEHPAALAHVPVKRVMTRRLIQRPPDTPVHEAAWLLWEGQSESILIVERGRLQGIVTTSDLLDVLHRACERRWPAVYREILVPIDVRNVPREALSTAVSLACQYQAHLTLVYVLPPFGSTLAWHSEPASAELLAQLDDDRKLLAWQRLMTLCQVLDAVRVTWQVAEGELVATLVTLAAELQADLMVMGIGRRRGVWGCLSKSTATRVLRAAPCPVLMVKEHGRRPHVRL